MNKAQPEARATRSPHLFRALASVTTVLVLGALAAGCAADPTELDVTVALDGMPSGSITSITVKVAGATATIQRKFASLGSVEADADVASFTFPRTLRYMISDNEVSGPVTVTVDGTNEPLLNPMTLATGSGPGVVEYHKTTATSVTITAVPPPTPDPATPQ